jgi:hypothetical protein
MSNGTNHKVKNALIAFLIYAGIVKPDLSAVSIGGRGTGSGGGYVGSQGPQGFGGYKDIGYVPAPPHGAGGIAPIPGVAPQNVGAQNPQTVAQIQAQLSQGNVAAARQIFQQAAQNLQPGQSISIAYPSPVVVRYYLRVDRYDAAGNGVSSTNYSYATAAARDAEIASLRAANDALHAVSPSAHVPYLWSAYAQ